MTRSYFLMLTWIAISSCSNNRTGKFICPAEFDEVEAIWMNWNSSALKTEGETARIILKITKEITPYAKMCMIVVNDSVKNAAINLMLQNGIDTSKVKFYFHPRQNRYIRDYGPVFLLSQNGRLKGVDFGFNCFGECEPNSEKAARGTIDSSIAEQLGLEITKTTVNSEGGNREVNGKGTMLSVEAVELQRNPKMTKQQLEDEYKRVLGVSKIIWLKKGSINDDKAQNGILPCSIYSSGTGGHIDEICRFADAKTILLAQQPNFDDICDTIRKINSIRLEENFEILKSATDQDGNPFNIFRVPTAPFIFDTVKIDDDNNAYFSGSQKGQTIHVLIASSYLNFIIVNQVVLVPKYFKEGGLLSTKEKDEVVVKIFKQVFPSKKIIQIDALELNFGGGGMHCATAQQPRSKIK